MPRRLVVSAHLDDAVLSAFSVMDGETTVVTVLAGLPPPGRVASWDAAGGATDSFQRVEERRLEDEKALAVVGATPVHLAFADGQYVSERMLAKPRKGDIVARLEPLLRDVTDVYTPAGIGNREHALVREAVLAVRPDAVLYADLPYALVPALGGFNLPRRVGREREPLDVWLEPAVIEAKLRAVRSYQTQLPQLERDFGWFVNDHGLGHERLWPPP